MTDCRIRCLILTHHLAKNGTETYIMNILRNLDRTKYIFDFYLEFNNKDGYYDEAIKLESKIYAHKYSRINLLRYIYETRLFFKQKAKSYHAVYFNGTNFSSIISLIYAKKYGIPIRIVHIHGSNTSGFHNKLLHFANKFRIAKTANVYLACSDTAKEWGYKHTTAYKSCRVIKNGINLDAFKYNPIARKRIRDMLGLKDEIVLGCIGRLSEVKNPIFSINIIYELSKQGYNIKLLFVGDGELRNTMERIVDNLSLNNSIIFLGIRNDINDIMQAIDGLLLPSLHEGLPFVTIEAQASNLPIFVSSNISNSVSLSSRVHFIPIDKGVNVWANSIMSTNFGNRDIPIDSRLYEYDINNVVTDIESIIK